MKTGIIKLYYSFLRYLREEEDKIAALQLTGRIEDYLVKEFIHHIYYSTKGNIFALTNLGTRGQRKIDISVIKGNDTNDPVIYGLIEVKYIRNKHRLSNHDATDEVQQSLKDLKTQIGPYKSKRHGDYEVQLSALQKNIYGLVFASYVNKEKEKQQEKKDFYKMILDKAKTSFRYHDLDKPYFRPIFEDTHVKVFNTNYYVSLKAGLWRIKGD